MERGARRAPAQACLKGSAYGMGRAMDARGREGRLAEAVATEWIRSTASALGSGTLLCLDLSQQKDEQGLREAMCKCRSVRICCHESSHAEAFSSLMRLFHTVSEVEFSEVQRLRAVRRSVRRVMSSSCSQPSPVKV